MSHPNNDLLRYLIKKHNLTNQNIADILSSDYGSVTLKSVNSWTCGFRNMPGPMMELLTIKLGDR